MSSAPPVVATPRHLPIWPLCPNPVHRAGSTALTLALVMVLALRTVLV